MKKYLGAIIGIGCISLLGYYGYININKAAVAYENNSTIEEPGEKLFNYDIEKTNKISIINGSDGIEVILEDKTQIKEIISNLNERKFTKGQSTKNIVGCGGYTLKIYYENEGNIDNLVLDSENKIRYNNYSYENTTSLIDINYIDNIYKDSYINIFNFSEEDISKINLSDGYTNKSIKVNEGKDLNALIQTFNNIKAIKQNSYTQSDKELTFKIDLYNNKEELIDSFSIGRNSVVYIGNDRYIDRNKSIKYDILFDLLEIKSTIVE